MAPSNDLNIEQELNATSQRLRSHLEASAYYKKVSPDHLREAAWAYLEVGGKYLRPCLLLWCCRALGGNEEKALPAALAIEVFHTWTLVHDDIIDRDAVRRGRPTIHEEFRRRGEMQLGLGEFSSHYGQSLAMLAGDVQHGWAVCLFSEAAPQDCHDEDSLALVLSLLRELEGEVLTRLVEGEVLDMQLSRRPLPEVKEEEILHLIAGKSAALFAFAAQVGAMLAKGRYCPEDAQVKALRGFGHHAGTAFQLQDDILGVSGREAELGKPVGSDVREGKRTLPLIFSWQHASSHLRRRLEEIVGKREASQQEIEEACALLQELGGIAHTRLLAEKHVTCALNCLEVLEPGPEKELLVRLAHFMVERTH